MNIPYTKLKENEKKLIINEYLIPENSVSSILKKHNISNYTLGRIRKFYDVKSRKITYSEEVIQLAIKDFKNGMNYTQITKKYGMSDTTFYKYLVKNGVNPINNKGRKNHFNQEYFKDIDSPDKAYFAGFLYADGSISRSNKHDRNHNRLSINISARDDEVLLNFCDFIKYNKTKIEYRKPKNTFSTNEMSRLYLNSKALVSSLLQNNFRTSKEESNGDFFKLIPDNLKSHFLRGLNDGDGSTSNKIFSITTQLPLIEYIQELLEKELNISSSKSYVYGYKNRGFKNTRDLRYTPTDSKKIFRYMYKDSTDKIRLSRKYNNIKHLL